MTDPWDAQMEALGAFIRSQRKLADLSLRQLAELTSLSNPYLSQLERGLHQPSVRVIKLLSGALDVSAEMLLAQAGLLDLRPDEPAAAAPSPAASVQAAIEADDRLDDEQRRAILAVYRSMLRLSGPAGAGPADAGPADAGPADAGPADAGTVDDGPADASR